MGVQNAWVFSTNHKTTRDWVVSLVENTHAFCTRTIIGRKQGYKMREYFLLENIERKFGWKSVSIFYHFDRTISSGIKKVAEKAQKNCFPLLRSGTKKYIICPNDDLLLWTSQSNSTKGMWKTECQQMEFTIIWRTTRSIRLVGMMQFLLTGNLTLWGGKLRNLFTLMLLIRQKSIQRSWI